MVTSLVSLALNKHVKKDVAMTGELTLTGKVLEIGGVKEKTIAAKRSGVKDIIFPKGNEKNWNELEPEIKKGLNVHFASYYEDVYKIAFE
jgi:ATP-dependent Lon protease